MNVSTTRLPEAGPVLCGCQAPMQPFRMAFESLSVPGPIRAGVSLWFAISSMKPRQARKDVAVSQSVIYSPAAAGMSWK